MEAGADLEQAGRRARELDPAGGRLGDAARIFSSVLLPAPLRPMMPTTSPAATSKETSRSAQKSSDRVVANRGRRPIDRAWCPSRAELGSEMVVEAIIAAVRLRSCGRGVARNLTMQIQCTRASAASQFAIPHPRSVRSTRRKNNEAVMIRTTRTLRLMTIPKERAKVIRSPRTAPAEPVDDTDQGVRF